MASLTRQQVADIIKNAPPGTSPAGIVAALRHQGHILEGYPIQNESTTPTQETDNTGDTGLKGVATGIAKGELSTLTSLKTIGNKIYDQTAGRVVNAVTGHGFTPTDSAHEMPTFDALTHGTQANTNITQANSTAEKIGKGVEQVAEFALPGSGATKLAKTAEGAIDGLGIAEKFGGNLLGKTLESGAKLATQSGIEGAAGTGITMAQNGGELDKNAIDNGIISAVFPLVSKGISSAGAVLKNADNAGRVVNSLIKPLLKDFSYGKNPGKAIAQEGIVANSLDELAQKVSIKRQQIGQQIEQALSTPEAKNKLIDIESVLTPLDEAYRKALNAPRTNKELLNRIGDTISDIMGETVDAKGNPSFSTKFVNITPLEATKIKRLIGDITKFTGNQSDDAAVNKALKQAYGIVRSKIEAAIPSIKNLNERYADLTSAEIATHYRDKINARQGLISLGTKVVGGTSALISAIATGGATLPTVVAGLGGAGLEKALETPAVKLRFAKWLAESSPEQKQKLFEAAPWVKGVVLSTVNNMTN